MRFSVITPDGQRFTLVELGSAILRQLIDGDPGARAVIQHAQQSHDAQRWGLADVLAGILNEPARASDLIDATPDADVSAIRVCAVLALAYRERTEGAGLEMNPDDQQDRDFMASLHPPARDQ